VANILAHKVRSLLTILGIIVGIVTVVLVVRSSWSAPQHRVAFSGIRSGQIFAFHLEGDPANPRIRPEELTRKPLEVDFARRIVAACPSIRDAAAQILVPNLINGRALIAKYRDLENANVQVQGATWNFPR